MANTLVFALGLMVNVATFSLLAPISHAEIIEDGSVAVGSFQAAPGNSSDLIELPNYHSTWLCLQSCLSVPGCSFVAYTEGNGTCQGLKASTQRIWLTSAGSEHMLLAPIGKNLTRQNGTDYVYGDILVNEEYQELEQQGIRLTTGIYGITVRSEKQCLNLCSIHPRCNGLTYTPSNQQCYLKALDHLTPTAKEDAISYVSA